MLFDSHLQIVLGRVYTRIFYPSCPSFPRAHHPIIRDSTWINLDRVLDGTTVRSRHRKDAKLTRFFYPSLPSFMPSCDSASTTWYY